MLSEKEKYNLLGLVGKTISHIQFYQPSYDGEVAMTVYFDDRETSVEIGFDESSGSIIVDTSK